MTKNNVKPRKTCTHCKRTIVEDNFYLCDSSPLYPDGRFHVCTRCLTEMFNAREDSYEVALMVLHAMNKPYVEDLWNDCEHPGHYFRQINSLPNYRGMTWDNSIFESRCLTSNRDDNVPVVTDEMIERYGAGYTDEEYVAFERKYKSLTKNYTEQTAMHSEGLISYIRFRVKEEMATARNDYKESKEWGAMAQRAAQDAKLNVSQLSKSDISGGVDLLTQLSEAVETKASVIPLLPKVLEQPYDDVDLILWANIDYNRMLEGKPRVEYRDIWNFYDEMLEEHFEQQGLTDEEIKQEKEKRNAVFRDLSHIYKEPLYEDDA